MGGTRIAEQVRRALIAAAKVAPVAVVIDASGCGSDTSCAYICCENGTGTCCLDGGSGGHNTGGFPSRDARALIFPGGGTGGTRDASTDASKDSG
jgi:hypothetical protein